MPAAQSKRAAVGIGNTMGDNVPSYHAMSDHVRYARAAQHALAINKEGDHELFDVVDDDDRVLGRMRRNDVHRWQLRHRAAHVLVVNSRGEVFVQRRSTLKECAPGLWDTSVAGHVQSGESYAACAVRELAEEIGLPPATPLCQVGYLKASPDTGWEFVAVFLCRSDGPLVLCPEEIADGRWTSPETLAQWMIARPGEFTTTFRLIGARSREWLQDSQRPAEIPPTACAHG
jgi:isopentenyl-diphosphate Delta-isomerase